MADITGGMIVYGETRKIADYESKTSRVELSFRLTEGEDLEAAMHTVMWQAQSKCHTMLLAQGIRRPEIEASKAVCQESGDVPDTSEPAEDKPKLRGRPRKVELIPKGPSDKPRQTPSPLEKTQTGPVSKDEFEDLPASKVSPAPVQTDVDDLLSTTEPEPARVVTDADLRQHINKTMLRCKDAVAIKKLAKGMFGITTGVFDIPQADRGRFIAALDQLPDAKHEAA